MRTLVYIVCLFTLSFSSAVAKEKKEKKVKNPRIEALKILESYTLPTVEISGMAWRKNPKSQRRELVLVSDRKYSIFLVDWENRKKEFKPVEVDLSSILAAQELLPKQSEWESVFCDDSGRIFIVQETPPRILVVSPDLKKIEKTVNLSVPKGSPDHEAWNGMDNSGGEGVLLLKNGHALVVKEKNPLQILEFAPEGQKASGYESRLSIEAGGLFPLGKLVSSELHRVFTWQLASEHEGLFEDSSGLNVDRKGQLYLLGDQRNMIASLGKKLKTEKPELKLGRLWSIPSEIKQPEGMVIDDDGHPIVAIDSKKTDKPNVFLLSPLK